MIHQDMSPIEHRLERKLTHEALISDASPQLRQSERGGSWTGRIGETRERESLQAEAIILTRVSDLAGSEYDELEEGDAYSHGVGRGRGGSSVCDDGLSKSGDDLSPSDETYLAPVFGFQETPPPLTIPPADSVTLAFPGIGVAGHRRRRPFIVFSIADGQCQKLFFSAPQLLRLVQATRSVGMDIHRSGCLKLRDLRQISSLGVSASRPSIEPRRSCVLVNMPHLRGLILRDRVFVFALESTMGILRNESSPATGKFLTAAQNPLLEPLLARKDSSDLASKMPLDETEAGANGISYQLLRKLLRLSSLKRAAPLEFLALEAMLFEVISKVGDSVKPAYDAIEVLSNQKESTYSISSIYKNDNLSSTAHLHQIRELKKFLQDAENVAVGIANSLTELLENDEDVRRLEVSRFHESPAEWDEPSDSPGAEEAEILLESYQQDIESILARIRATDDTLDTLLQIMQLQLATTRNFLLKLELAMQVVSVMVAVIGAIAGIFGMNIPNGYEDRGDVFWFMLKMFATCAVLMTISVFVVATRLRL